MSMIKSKVFEILNSFSREEFKNFFDFVSSPYFNKKLALITLTEIYQTQHPDFDDQSFTKEKVFKKIFPGKEYNDEVFRNLNSDLIKLCDSFLSQINFDSDTFLSKKHLICEITKKKLYSFFEKAFNDARKTVENYNNKDLKYMHDMYELFLEKDIFNGYALNFSKDDITEAQKYLLKYFAIKIIEIQNYILYQCRMHGLDKDLVLENEFIDSFLLKIPDDMTESIQIQIYYYNLKLEQTNDEKYYHELKKLLSQNANLIEKENLYNMYENLQGFIQRTKANNDISSISELFQLRRIVIEKKIYTENFISNSFFLNMVKSGIHLKELNWVENFINNYSNIVAYPFRKSTKELSLALLNFANKDYDFSLAHLANVKYENSLYNLSIKNLTSRIYYEKNDFIALGNILNSYRAYLGTNKTIGDLEINSHNLFITNVYRLMKIKEDKNYDKLEIVEDSVMKIDFPSKIWMLEKIEELNKEEQMRINNKKRSIKN